MKKLRAILTIGSIFSYILISNNPLDDALNFIVGGSIPGTKTAIGFWPSIGIILFFLWLISKYIKSLKLQDLEYTAKEIQAKNQLKEFSDTYGDTDKTLQKAILGQKEYSTNSL